MFCWRQRQILDKSLSGVFSDSNTKELLSEAEQESDNLETQIAAAEGSEMVPVQVIKTGLTVLRDMGAFWQKAGLTTRQWLQRFLFPEGIPFGESGFGTSATGGMLCCETVTVWNRPENVTVVDPTDSSWNLLLRELSELSKIAEQAASRSGRESCSTAAPERREARSLRQSQG